MIGIFDSGYGGLTVMKQILNTLPEYDYVYLGDNARAPYGSRSFEVVYDFTREAVEWLFAQGCPLVILACNTASAKALRNIQQLDLPKWGAEKRVLGVIRPTVEIVGELTKSRHIGIFATAGTVNSQSYTIEISKLFPDIHVTEQACPLWVPLIENREYNSDGADYFVRKYIDELIARDSEIDTVVLGCTHYPLLEAKIRACLPPHIQIVTQGKYVADSLLNYLQRHSALDKLLTRNGKHKFYTTESPERFAETASLFLDKQVNAQHTDLPIRS